MPRLAEIFGAADRVCARTRRIDRRRQLRRLALRAQQRARARSRRGRRRGRPARSTRWSRRPSPWWRGSTRSRARAPTLGRPPPPLQVLLFNSNNARERVLPSPVGAAAEEAKVREIYWHGAGAWLHRPVLLRARRQWRAREAEGTPRTATAGGAAGARHPGARPHHAAAVPSCRHARPRIPTGASGPCCGPARAGGAAAACSACWPGCWPHRATRPPRWRSRSSCTCRATLRGPVGHRHGRRRPRPCSGFVPRPEDVERVRTGIAALPRRDARAHAAGAAGVAALRGRRDAQALPGAQPGPSALASPST